MTALVVLVVGLGAAGVVPAAAVARRSAVVVFLAPLIGAVMAAVAATVELGAGGSLVADYVAVAAAVNLAVAAWWLAARRSARPRAMPAWGWSAGSLLVVLGCLAVPLMALRTPMFGWDANSIWLTHALLVYGGHHELLTGLQSAAYQFSNPDYPPLVPAAGALAFKFYGLGNLHLAVVMTVLLTACAVGVTGMGIAAAGSGGRRPARIAAVGAAGAICVVAFAVSSYSAVEGYTDLLWAAAAAAAVIWGLVLPQGTQALGVAWVCAAVASLTKNEGLTTALVVLVLIALRYRPLTLPGPKARRWAERAAFVLLPALPGLAWAGLIRQLGVHDAFFQSASVQSPLTRADATLAAMAAHLGVAPVALAVLLAGCWWLRGDRERSGLGNPAWLWISCLGSLAIIFATYLVGWIEIHSWLAASVYRTTIFAQLLLYCELAVWLVIAVDPMFPRADGQRPDLSAGERAPEVLNRPREPLPEGPVGSQPSSSRARLMSGWRRAGSSAAADGAPLGGGFGSGP
jgi:hypothetical protein